jgi:hypothetical protein
MCEQTCNSADGVLDSKAENYFLPLACRAAAAGHLTACVNAHYFCPRPSEAFGLGLTRARAPSDALARLAGINSSLLLKLILIDPVVIQLQRTFFLSAGVRPHDCLLHNGVSAKQDQIGRTAASEVHVTFTPRLMLYEILGSIKRRQAGQSRLLNFHQITSPRILRISAASEHSTVSVRKHGLLSSQL